jgi:hypothetical protein
MFGIRTYLRAQLRALAPTLRLPRHLRRRLTLAELRERELTRQEQYWYCIYYFDHFLPAAPREHRAYFSQEKRGFGEDAFHAMWFLLFEELRPSHALEIGVYRGQTITLWKLLSRHFGFDCRVSCVSPFAPAGDSVSQYERSIDYYEDTLQNHRHFGLELPEICRDYSTAPEARRFIASRNWQVIYIDGNHDYEVAREDWVNSAATVVAGGIIVLDDSALGTSFSPPGFSTAGHPGPSRIAGEIDASSFQEILSVGHNRVFQRLLS